MALIDKKLTELTEILSVPDNAFIHVVDPNDVSQSPQGSSYKAKKSTIGGAVKAQVTVSGTVKTNINNADPIVYLKGSVDALLAEKQDTLVNGINIASINSQNLLNGGNIEIATNTNINVIEDNTILRTLSLSDVNSLILFTQNSISNISVVVPLNIDVPFPIGTQIALSRSQVVGSQTLLSISGNGVNFISPNGLIANRRGKFILNKVAVNTWLVSLIIDFQYGNVAGTLGANFDNVGAGILFAGIVSISQRISSPSGYLRFSLGFGENHWEANRNIRYTGGIALTQPTELTPKSYVDAIPNPTLNFLPKKGASGFVDSAISEDATNVLSAKVLRLAAGLTPSNAQDLATVSLLISKANLSGGNTFTGTQVLNANNLTTPSFSLIKNNQNSGNPAFVINGGDNNEAWATFKVSNFGYAILRSEGSFFYDFNTLGNFGTFAIRNGGQRALTINEQNLFLVNKSSGNSEDQFQVNGNIQTNALLKLGQFTTATEPAYVKGASFFNTTLNKSKIGGETIYETQITGTGTIGKIQKTNAEGVIGDSAIFNNGTNVGINVDSSNALQVHSLSGSTNLAITNSTTGNGGSSGINIIASSNDAFFINRQPDSNITFRTASRFIFETGNVLINTQTNNGVDKLQVNGNIQTNSLIKLGQFTTATEPAYVKGASFFNTTLNKMRIGGATAYETVTSS
jgi:hypothetical protein